MLDKISLRTKNALLRKIFRDGNFQNKRLKLRITRDIPDQSKVPINCRIKTKLKWLAGLMDMTGSPSGSSIYIPSENVRFLENVKLLLQTLGCDVSRRLHKSSGNDGTMNIRADKYRLIISTRNLSFLRHMGLVTYYVKLGDGNTRTDSPSNARRVFIKKIEQKIISDTYCFEEESGSRTGIFNGIIAGLCAEDVNVSS